MISLSSDLTDAKGRRASAGWLFFDADCPACTGLARRFRPLLEEGGYGLAPLQSPRVRVLLGVPQEELLREMRLLTPSGSILSGADAFLHVAQDIWWARPLVALARITVMRALLHRAYRWFAARRHCLAGTCTPPDTRSRFKTARAS